MGTRRAVPFAGLLKHYRTRAGLSQEDLAERTGLSARAISDLERGISFVPRNATLRLLGEALGLPNQDRATFEAAARANPPLLPNASVRRRSLPLQLTPFIGREREVEKVQQVLLEPHVRLLTLTGPGGIGKTRLALQAAERSLDEFADGVYFVNLASITDADMVAPAIAHALGVGEAVGQRVIETLEEHLRERHLLLVLDNFEQVTLGAPLISALLAACPRLRILATSRVVLRLGGEHTYRVPPLTLPDPRRPPSATEIREYEGVRLFIARAQAAKPEFGITEANAAAIAEICRRLDGLPLALELAAASVRLLSPQAMLARLGDRLELLTGGPRDAPARQRTLRATLHWSYDLLDEPQRRLLQCLSVFPGGCGLEAAEAVCGTEGGVDAFGGLSSLLDSSLLRQEEAAGGEVRLGMLETVREYALARLAESGEGEAVYHRQAQYYLTLVEESELGLVGVRQAEWLDRLESEHDNLSAVLVWSLARGELELALRIGGGLWRFWFIRGYFQEWERWLAAVRDQAPKVPATGVPLAKALLGRAVLLLREEHIEEASALASQSLDIYQAAGDTWGVAASLVILGKFAAVQSEEAWERGRLAEGLRLARKVGEPWLLGWALFHLGDVAWIFSAYVPATELLAESLTICRRAGDRQGVAAALTALGWLAVRHAGDYQRATALLQEAHALSQGTGDKLGITNALLGLAMVGLCEGKYESARALTEERSDIERGLGNRHGLGHSHMWLGLIASAQGHITQAEAYWEQSLAIYRELGDTPTRALVLNHLGWMALEQGLRDPARARFEESLALSRGSGDKRGIAHVLGGLAAIAWAEGDHAQARAYWEESLALWRELGDKRGASAALAELATAARARGDDVQARALQEQSWALRRELRERQDIAEWQSVWRDWRR